MSVDLWRERLREKVASSGRSAHALSKALGWGDNEVKRMLKDNSSVKVDAVIALCREIPADPAYIFSGYSVAGPLGDFLRSDLAKDENRVRALLAALGQ